MSSQSYSCALPTLTLTKHWAQVLVRGVSMVCATALDSAVGNRCLASSVATAGARAAPAHTASMYPPSLQAPAIDSS